MTAMTNEPYAQCRCGSGKKMKWCCQAVVPTLDRIDEFLAAGKRDKAMALADQSIAANPGRGPANMLLRLHRCSVALEERPDDARTEYDKLFQEYSEAGLPRESFGELLIAARAYAEAAKFLGEALARYPADATERRAAAWLKLGACQDMLNLPLAAWASWQQALKAEPTLQDAQEAIAQSIGANPFLPVFVRQGVRLRSPDQLAIFNEGRRRQWDEALGGERSWRLEEVRDAFARLATDDPHDAAAQFNLGLASAWLGDNVSALAALDHYVRLEDNADAAANAWDLGEVLRAALPSPAHNDLLDWFAVYRIVDANQLGAAFQDWKRVVSLRSENGVRLHLLDRDLENLAAGAPLLGGQPRMLAQLAVLEGMLMVVATSSRKLAEAKAALDARAGLAIAPAEEATQPGVLDALDFEGSVLLARVPDESYRAEREKQAARYFETAWIHEPLVSLGGAAPVDAAQHPALKKKLEGVIRHRERAFARYSTGYNFDRLRNRLGLMSLVPPGTTPAESPLDFGAFSAPQLAELKPAELEDAQVASAYRAALTLDAPTLALRFAEDLARRPAAAELVDMGGVFRRMVLDRLERRKFAEAVAAADAGVAYDAAHADGKHAPALQALRGRALLAADRPDDAAAAFRNLFDKHADAFKAQGEAVETCLRAGRNPLAKELAERGLAAAQKARERDVQEQFREYLDEASRARK